MQRIAKLARGASPLVALLFVVMTTFGGGVFIAMASGSSSPLFSCAVVQGVGNAKLTNAYLPVGKVPLGLLCNGTKFPPLVASSTGKPGTKGNSLFFSCNAVLGVGNTKLTISPPLQGAFGIGRIGLNCKVTGVNITGISTAQPGANTSGLIVHGHNRGHHNGQCEVGVDPHCVAISCSVGGVQVPCIRNDRVVRSCTWTDDPTVDVNGCVYNDE